MEIEKDNQSEFQRYSTDTKGLDIVFYQALCGWRLKTEKSQATIMKTESSFVEQTYKIEKSARYCNEECASSMSSKLHGLVSQITSTGKLSGREIFDLWNGMIDAVNFDLLTNYYVHGNTYDIKIESLDIIIAFCCTFSAYTKKAIDGFTLKQFTDTIMSIFNSRMGGEPTQKKGNPIANLLNLK